MSDDTARRIRETAIAALCRREHSRAELEAKLSAKGYAQSAIGPELDRLAEERLQDDRRFAESYVNYRIGRGYGPMKIRAELRQRGVDDAVSNAVFETLDVDWGTCIDTAWRKKFAGAPGDYREYAKQARFLQYRGFTSDQIARVLG